MRWILWMIQENLKKWNQITVGDCLTFPVNLQWFHILVPCWAATNACLLTHGIQMDFRKTFLYFSPFDSPQDHPQGIHSCATQKERGSVPQATGRGSFFTRDDKQNRDTTPMQTFAGRPSNTSSSIRVEFLQNSMVGQRRQQISELRFDIFPNPQTFLVWKIRFDNQVTTCSDFPSEAMSRPVSGKNFPNFEILDAKIAAALNKIIQNSHFKKKVSLEEQKAQKEDRFLRVKVFYPFWSDLSQNGTVTWVAEDIPKEDNAGATTTWPEGKKEACVLDARAHLRRGRKCATTPTKRMPETL